MLAQLVEAAVRSFALGAFVWLSLTVFRVQNPQVRMTVWTVVLAVSLTMPGLTRWMKVTIPAFNPPMHLENIVWTDVPPAILLTPAASRERPASGEPRPQAAKAAPALPIDWRFIAAAIYLAGGGILLLRLLIGLALMRRIIRTACAVKLPWPAPANVRVSSRVAMPFTFASTILLPTGYTGWSERKLQAVMCHEVSHVNQGDFYVLLLAAIHRAVFWFNPFAWWLYAHLARLAEMVSDDAAIAGLCDRRCYADILLDMAKTAQPLPAGLAMARPSMVPWRIERILEAAGMPVRIGSRQRLLTALMLGPLAALSAVTAVQRAVPRQSRIIIPVADTLGASGSEQLDRYTGQFEIGFRSVLTISRQGEELFAQTTGAPELRLVAVGGNEFADEFGDVNITFAIGDDWLAPEVILRERNVGLRRGTRIDPATAGGIETAFQRRMATAPDRFRDQIPVPGGEAALRQTIEDLRRASPDFGGMSPQLENKLRKMHPHLHTSLALFGAIESVFFRGVGPGGYDVYGVKFANGSAEFRIDLAPGGTLEDVTFRPDGDGTEGGIAACAQEPSLKSAQSTVPIRLSLTNRGGAAIRLFRLNPAGRRVAQATLDQNASMFVWTAISQPWILADLSGQCQEIILPGQLTRYYTVESRLPGGLPDLAASPARTAQMPGSDEVLRWYIDTIRDGVPGYERMTAEAAAGTRQFLSRRQVILAKFGALQAMNFQGISPSGNDIYKVQFANGSAEWQIGLLSDGRIRSIELGPQF